VPVCPKSAWSVGQQAWLRLLVLAHWLARLEVERLALVLAYYGLGCFGVPSSYFNVGHFCGVGVVSGS